jgi:hypothetical protein
MQYFVLVGALVIWWLFFIFDFSEQAQSLKLISVTKQIKRLFEKAILIFSLS